MNTLAAIEVAINAHYSPHPFSPKSPVLDQARAHFIDEGIMETRCENEYGKIYFLTPKGEAWIKMLCATPFPSTVFINPTTKEIIQ